MLTLPPYAKYRGRRDEDALFRHVLPQKPRLVLVENGVRYEDPPAAHAAAETAAGSAGSSAAAAGSPFAAAGSSAAAGGSSAAAAGLSAAEAGTSSEKTELVAFAPRKKLKPATGPEPPILRL